MENKTGIYSITNQINNKFYIGSAINLKERKRIHLKDLKRNKHHSIKLQHAYNKYGEENFIFEVIEYVEDKNKLIEREQYYLDTLLFAQEYIKNNDKRFKKLGYNISPTAGSSLGVKRNKEFIEKLRKNMTGRFLGKLNPNYGKPSPNKGKITPKNVRDKIRITKKNRIEIIQYDLYGKKIRCWDSIAQAEKELKIVQIKKCLVGERKTAGGFIWKYKNKDTPKSQTVIKKSVLQYDLSGKFIKEWLFVKLAERDLNINNISNACVGIMNSAGGFIWRYKENDNIPQEIDISNVRFDNSKIIFQYDMNWNFIKEWKNCAAAEKELKIWRIGKVINGQQKSTGGYIWQYKINNSTQKQIGTIKKILQYDLENNFIKEWENITIAENILKIHGIGKVANGKGKSAGGYIWRFK